MKSNGKRYSAATKARFAKLVAGGLTPNAAAKKVGCSTYTAYYWAGRVGKGKTKKRTAATLPTTFEQRVNALLTAAINERLNAILG